MLTDTWNMLPDTQSLAAGLAAVFGDRPVGVRDRMPNPQAGVFASEIVTCTLSDGTDRTVFCKYGPLSHDSPDGRPGLQYEALVHRLAVTPAKTTSPQFIGDYTDAATGRVWLVFDHLGGALQVDHAPSHERAMTLAAGWIGRFHAAYESHKWVGSPLMCYDRAYYAQWPRRTAELAGDLHDRYPWLATACARSEGVVTQLLDRPQTVIHGDYYADNVLYRDGGVYPIDWEWAAIAAGEIDLACLTSRWPDHVVTACVREYCSARWLSGPPSSFTRHLDIARLFMCFRYMGISHEFIAAENRRWRFDAVRRLSAKLGLL